MAEELCYIPDDDGYTESAYISRMPNLHPAVRLHYRPARTMERLIVSDQIRSKATTEAERIIAQEVADRIVSWDIKLKDGSTAPINAKFIHLLKAPLFRRLCAIVYFNTEGGDPDPVETSEERQAKLRHAAQAASSGVSEMDAHRGN